MENTIWGKMTSLHLKNIKIQKILPIDQALKTYILSSVYYFLMLTQVNKIR